MHEEVDRMCGRERRWAEDEIVRHPLETFFFSEDDETPYISRITLGAIESKAMDMQFACAAVMDYTLETTRIVPKAEQRAYLEDVLKAKLDPKMMTALPEDFHPETHNEEGLRDPRHSVLHTSMGIKGMMEDGYSSGSSMPTMDTPARFTPAPRGTKVTLSVWRICNQTWS